MSMHKIPLTPVEEDGLASHGLPIGVPSQSADCFRQGVAWGIMSERRMLKPWKAEVEAEVRREAMKTYNARFKEQAEVWAEVDSYARHHPQAKLGGPVAQFALRLMKERDEALPLLEKLRAEIEQLKHRLDLRGCAMALHQVDIGGERGLTISSLTLLQESVQHDNENTPASAGNGGHMNETTAAASEIVRLNDVNARQAIDVRVLELSIAVVSRALDEFVGACIDADGNPRTPDRGAVMRARAILPPACKHALKKAKHDT